ncbi:tripartite tricarboxylate transporter TctB family protein [Marinobacter sp. S6332]|uniref:tripartite tricarboxylate transporter TctB family protein n=1 Tax=Marinobacter sp. S6332 TaxID=2926403 RepID=UPI001FF55B43|nr:tripartite tricarboxylate transporter TctB family protein [Marinobacter sp. S6332]MCK0165643.1 tripartite tricarboxylate transporter TctB family protein [Marinobacter sp. S6332]
MRSNDKITGLVTVTFGVLVITNSRGLANLPQQDYGAGTFPMVIGGLLIAFGGLLTLRGLRSSAPLMVWVNDVPIKRFYLTLLAIIAAIVAYILLVPVVGFPIVSTVLLSLLLYGFYRQNWTLAACTAVASTAVIWVVFGRLLQVPLELGILEKVVY